MNRSLVYGILIIVGFVGGIYLLTQMDKEYQWNKSYNVFEDEPYNLTVLHDVLEGEHLVDKNQPLYDYLHKFKGTNNCYFLIANNCFLSDKEEIDSLLSFVEKGNKAFLSIDNINDFTGNQYNIYNQQEEEAEAVEHIETETQEGAEDEEWGDDQSTQQDEENTENDQEPELMSFEDYSGEYQEADTEIIIEEDSYVEPIESTPDELDQLAQIHQVDQDDEVGKIEENEGFEGIDGADGVDEIEEDTTETTHATDQVLELIEEANENLNNKGEFYFPLADSLAVRFDQYKTDTIRARLVNDPNNVIEFVAKEIKLEDKETSLEPTDESYFYISDFGEAQVLGHVDEHINFIAVPYGKGTIYFHTTPVLFTNYVMVQDSGMKYVEKVFSVLSENDTIIWDHLNQNYHSHKRNYNKPGDHEIRGPFSFIFDNRSLKYAWYSILATTLLFLVFYTRRMQRSVLIILPVKNNSVEFAKTIGMLYMQSNHHNYIVKYQMKYLLLFIKNKYRIQLKDDMTNFLQDLNYRSEIPQKVLTELFNKHESIKNNTKLSDKELLSFNSQINYFYSNCK